MSTPANMTRIELEKRLRALGWAPAEASGTTHINWRHPKRRGLVSVRQVDLINRAVAEQLLIIAGER